MPIRVVTNLVTNSRLALDNIGWRYTFASGSGSGVSMGGINRVTTGGPLANAPTYGTYTRSAGAGDGRDYFEMAPARIFGILGGFRYRFSGWVRTPNANRIVSIRWIWYDGKNRSMGASTYAPSPFEPLPANIWKEVSANVVAPWEAASVIVNVTMREANGALMEANTFDVSAFMVTRDVADQTPYTGGFFDGATTNIGEDITFDFTGAAHTTASNQRVALRAALAPSDTADAAPVSTTRDFSPLKMHDYSVVEDSTPVDPSDSSGGTGQITLTVDETVQTKTLVDFPIDLSVASQGVTRGTIRSPSATNGVATLVADSRLTLLSVRRKANPFTGTLQAAFTYYLGLCGINSGLVFDDAIKNNAVVFPGWNGIVWDYMKKMATAQNVEISLISNNIVLRPIRKRNAEVYRDSSRAWSLDTSQLARAIEIYYYNPVYRGNGLIYPRGGWNPDVPVYNVNAGETIEVDIPLDGTIEGQPLGVSIASITQPVCVASVSRTFSTGSVYAVVGTGEGSDLPIPPAQWTAGGGSVTVTIGDDTRSIKVKIVGSSDTRYAPYRIAMTAGPSNNYSSLRLIGSGVHFERKKLTMETSANPDRISSDIGATIDNEFIATENQARSLGRWALKRYGAPRHTITVSSSGINRVGDTGSYRYPTVAEFNAANVGKTVAQFNAEWNGKSIQQFNEYWVGLVRSDFANQAFGNVGGARLRVGDAMFRIRSATITPRGIQYTAEEDTTVADFNEVWAGATIADFNREWAGYTAADFAIAPLRRTRT